jgi:formate dehydrogenase subunit delta
MTTAERVVREANLIARNFECLGRERAGTATAEHIARFWAPLLKDTLFSEAEAHHDRFSPIALDAIVSLRPAGQARAA